MTPERPAYVMLHIVHDFCNIASLVNWQPAHAYDAKGDPSLSFTLRLYNSAQIMLHIGWSCGCPLQYSVHLKDTCDVKLTNG